MTCKNCVLSRQHARDARETVSQWKWALAETAIWMSREFAGWQARLAETLRHANLLQREHDDQNSRITELELELAQVRAALDGAVGRDVGARLTLLEPVVTFARRAAASVPGWQPSLVKALIAFDEHMRKAEAKGREGRA
jgi:hypothetical protein